MAMGMASSSRRGRGRGSRRAPMAEINVTPLVDVMLVLLIIFMITAPMLASGVPLELPDSRANPLDQDPDQITVSIDENGFIYMDDALVENGTFPDRLQTVECGSPQAPLITVRADTSLDYGRVMAVMGELNRAGCNSVSLVTNSSDSQP